MDGTQFLVIFEDPFWVGILDSRRYGKRFVARVVFGAEPTNAELVVFMRDRFAFLLSDALMLPQSEDRSSRIECAFKNARRGLRSAARDQRSGSGKSLAAFHAAFEKNKADAQATSTRKRDTENAAQYEKMKEKRKLARRGK